MKNKKGFTLIELISVIIIIGVVMLIAIPSVSDYIVSSKKSVYVSMAKNYIDGARVMVNHRDIPIERTPATYYVPVSCIDTETNQDSSPYGKWKDAYVVIDYDTRKYTYYWTSTDEADMGINLTKESDISEESILADVAVIDPTTPIDEDRIVYVLDKESCKIEKDEPEPTPVEPDPEPEIDPKETGLFKIIKVGAVSDSSVDFSQAQFLAGKYETNSEISTTKNYYFRGNVLDNYILLNGRCWRMLRTTDTGGVKIVYSGKSNNDKTCDVVSWEMQSDNNSGYNTNASLGYMYGDAFGSTKEAIQSNQNDSKIKKIVDDFYKNTILNTPAEALIEDTVYCNDRRITQGTGANADETYYAAYERFFKGSVKPTLECPQYNDRFTVSSSKGNGSLMYPVGLVTIDEVILSGMTINQTSGYTSPVYLTYGNNVWWTMTPLLVRNSQSMNGVIIQGDKIDEYSGGIWSWYEVRPVISIKSGVEVTGGDGTAANPYTLL